MNTEVGSIMAAFHQIRSATVYDNEVPQNFVVPSWYVPPPFSFNGPNTLSTFMKTFSLTVKLFEVDQDKAYAGAETIADSITEKRLIVPLLNPDGTPTEQFIRLKRIETRVTGVIALITVTWDSCYYYEREEVQSLNEVFLEGGIKE